MDVAPNTKKCEAAYDSLVMCDVDLQIYQLDE